MMSYNANKELKVMNNLEVTSAAFEQGGRIPDLYTAKGDEISPPLTIKGIDPNAKTLAIISDDPDAPIPFIAITHWVVYNIPAHITDIHEDIKREPVIESLEGALQGRNGFGRIAYLGPNPPFGTHTYRFAVYALDTELDLKPGATKRQLLKAMEGHILQSGMLEGVYGS